jgi:hypothetical protein
VGVGILPAVEVERVLEEEAVLEAHLEHGWGFTR